MVREFLLGQRLELRYVLETHAHADHISGAQVLKKYFPQAQLTIGKEICSVQKTFGRLFNLGPWFKMDGSQFDVLLADGDTLTAGKMTFRYFSTPGHTPACGTYVGDNVAFTGDALFMPDSGTGRCDFPGGSAETLYDSIQKIYALPGNVRTCTGHDYQPNKRQLLFESTVSEQKKSNIHLKGETKKEDFVKFRTERDATLSAPRLLLPSIQININAGQLPPADSNEVSYLRIPVAQTR
jgi:glyoxylase-like metal-dependent hydrolase (beta-lactamase superfamily II)